LSCGSYTFISYRLADCGSCLTTHPSFQNDSGLSAFEPRVPITVKLKKLLKDVEIQTKYEYIFISMERIKELKLCSLILLIIT